MAERSAPPPEIAGAFGRLPDPVRDQAMAMRALILDLAEELRVGPLTNTLKWGEPARLTGATKAGCTIRPGARDTRAAVLLNCSSGLAEGFRADFPDASAFAGARALCLSGALTRHRDKWKGGRQ